MKLAPDNSENVGSTSFIPWGDNSKYHYALLGYYGIEQFLQRQHISPYVDSGAINFSSETLSTAGEGARKLLLSPQWGGTVLNVNALRRQVPDPGTFLLSLSDGEIQNWRAIRDDYKTIVTSCSSAHIQIGGKNSFSCDLESWGVPVYYVTEGKDLVNLMVCVASNKYKSYGRVTV